MFMSSFWKWVWIIFCIIFWPIALAVILIAIVMFVAGGSV